MGDNHWIPNHKVVAWLAKHGKRVAGWFYGVKLHLMVDDCGKLLACQITLGNVDPREPVAAFSGRLFGNLITDRGYNLQALFEQLLETFVSRSSSIHESPEAARMRYRSFILTGDGLFEMHHTVRERQPQARGTLKTHLDSLNERSTQAPQLALQLLEKGPNPPNLELIREIVFPAGS